jgi:hypothetical protein
MSSDRKVAVITRDTSGIGLEAMKRWCMELWLLKTAFGLPEIANPDAVKAIEEEEITSNCGPDQGSSKVTSKPCAHSLSGASAKPSVAIRS